MFNYDDYVTIKIIKVKDSHGNFDHWEQETKFSENWYASEGTSPDFYGTVDMSLDYIREVAQYWTSDDTTFSELRTHIS